MQCQFRANQPIHIHGQLTEGTFRAELDDYIEALLDHGLVEPVFAPEEPRESPVWEAELSSPFSCFGC